jgi:predicted RNA binding protein YcfA (HicA-like mRNA interferase family)
LPRLPRPSGRQLGRALEKAGFVLRRVRGDHASYHHSVTDRTTTVPLTTRTLPAGTVAKILKDAGLTPEELRELLR